jgi:hypothetical protein
MLEPYAEKLARTVLRGPGRSQDFPGHPTPAAKILCFLSAISILLDVAFVWRWLAKV